MAIKELMSMKHLQAGSLDCDWVEAGRTVLMLYMLFSRLLFTAYSSGLVSFRMPETTAGCCAVPVYKYCETTACQPLQSIKTNLVEEKSAKGIDSILKVWFTNAMYDAFRRNTTLPFSAGNSMRTTVFPSKILI